MATKSQIRLTCPVTGKTSRHPLTDDAEGEFEVVDADDAIETQAQQGMLPRRWGSVVIDVVIDNPEIEQYESECAAVEDLRAKRLVAALEEIDVALENDRIPQAQRDRIEVELKSGKAEQDAREIIADQISLPDPPDSDTAVARLQLPVLSDEGVDLLIQTLQAAGFPIGDLP